MACREHLAQLRERQKDIETASIKVFVVTFEPMGRARHFVVQEGIPFPVLSDTHGSAYDALGLRRGHWWEIWGWETIKSYARNLLLGRWPRLPSTDVSRLGGDFLLDGEGRIVLAHRSGGPADRPSVEELLEAAKNAAG